MYKSHKLSKFVRISFCLCLQRVYTNIMNLINLTMATGIGYAYDTINPITVYLCQSLLQGTTRPPCSWNVPEAQKPHICSRNHTVLCR